jgi:hypothetical protein
MSEIKSKEWIRNYVLMVIDEVKEIPKEEREKVSFRQKMAMKHQTFFEKFPGILMIVLDSGEEFDLDQFDMMLDAMERVHKGEEDFEEVNKGMGKKYFDEYVAPKIDMDKEKL